MFAVSSFRRDKHRDKDRDREHKEHHSSKEHKSSHRDKDKHHSSSKSSHDRHKERESKKSLENGVVEQQQQQLQQQQEQPDIKAEPDVVEVKEELRDPLDTSNYSFNETNAIRTNGIRECFVNVSQISNSSCDYSMSQFRPDESAFSVKGMTGFRYDDDSRDIGDYDQGDNNGNGGDNDNGGDDGESDEDMPIAKRKKIKREISDDDDDEDLPLTARKKAKPETKKAKKIKREPSDDEEDDDDYDKPKKKKIKKEKVRSPPFKTHVDKCCRFSMCLFCFVCLFGI